jgi:uncharacterized protein YndB with AHSA1/START domain
MTWKTSLPLVEVLCFDGFYVREFEENSRITIEWGEGDDSTTVKFRLIPLEGDTYVQITDTGFGGNGDQIVARIADSTGGFTNVLCELKALLEHDVELNVVLDYAPPEAMGH